MSTKWLNKIERPLTQEWYGGNFNWFNLIIFYPYRCIFQQNRTKKYQMINVPICFKLQNIGFEASQENTPDEKQNEAIN